MTGHPQWHSIQQTLRYLGDAMRKEEQNLFSAPPPQREQVATLSWFQENKQTP
jgi:hypothetical protein